MGIFDRFIGQEARSLEDPTATNSTKDFLSVMGWGDFAAAAGVTVNVDTAMGVPAIWAAVNFIGGTLAGLPLHVYRKTDAGRERVTEGFGATINTAVNDEMSSFEWRKYMFEQVLTGGRSITYIERDGSGNVRNLHPIDPNGVLVERKVTSQGFPAKSYRYNQRIFKARDIIDLTFMVKANQLDPRGPIATNKDAIGMAIAASQYGAKAFQSGGIPPAVLQGPFQSGAAASRASEDVAAATAKLAKEGRPIMALPLGHELKSVGFSPEQMQLIELQRFSIEQIARIYSLPPIFLQDLTRSTFTNSEQQDLHFVKHTLKRWIEQAEQEMNLKLFGRGSDQYVEFNVDGLLRGDFKTRMEAHATSIQNGIRTPNEVRDLENMSARDEGNDLMIQGATVPIKNQVIGDQDE
jgi:HK97 family phage portal protein